MRRHGCAMILACPFVLLVPGLGAAAVPDPVNSFFVPQVGTSYTSPTEGIGAIPYFRACPNNDDGASLPLNARIQVVVRDVGGVPIPGIAPADVCILFNGGTPAQGFTGAGADSVIANGTFNMFPLCPDVRCVYADAPTDANGATFITFTGPGGVRDPNRKWGHYDSELPVFALGIKLAGRLTSSAPPGSYVLQIKNFDWAGGLGTAANVGEAVTSSDYNGVANNLGGTVATNPLNYWRDFDSDGTICIMDLNMISWHITHDCDTPFNP